MTMRWWLGVAVLVVVTVAAVDVPTADPQTKPVPPAKTNPPTIEELVKQLTDVRQQIDQLRRREQELAQQLSTEVERLLKLLADLGIRPGPPTPPGPTPPTPPTPPGPTLAEDIRKTWERESDPSKARQAKILAAIYRLAAREATSADVHTCGDLAEIIALAVERAEGLGPDSLPLVRDVVRGYLRQAAPDLEAALTPRMREAVAAIYATAAATLEELAK